MLSPGPNILAVIGTSMVASRKAGIVLAMGIAAGSFLWASTAAIGLTTLIATYASVPVAIKIVGGLYLLLLAFKAFRSALAANPVTKPSGMAEEGWRRLFLRGRSSS